MSMVLGKNQYGKAENRVVRIHRDPEHHQSHDVTVSTSLPNVGCDADGAPGRAGATVSASA